METYNGQARIGNDDLELTVTIPDLAIGSGTWVGRMKDRQISELLEGVVDITLLSGTFSGWTATVVMAWEEGSDCSIVVLNGLSGWAKADA